MVGVSEHGPAPGTLGLHETERWPGAYWVTFELGDRRYAVSRCDREREGWESRERLFLGINARGFARRRASEALAQEAFDLVRGGAETDIGGLPSADDWAVLAACREALEASLSAEDASVAAARFASLTGTVPGAAAVDAFERVFLPAARVTERDLHASAEMLEGELLSRFRDWADEIERVLRPDGGIMP